MSEDVCLQTAWGYETDRATPLHALWLLEPLSSLTSILHMLRLNPVQQIIYRLDKIVAVGKALTTECTIIVQSVRPVIRPNTTI